MPRAIFELACDPRTSSGLMIENEITAAPVRAMNSRRSSALCRRKSLDCFDSSAIGLCSSGWNLRRIEISSRTITDCSRRHNNGFAEWIRSTGFAGPQTIVRGSLSPCGPPEGRTLCSPCWWRGRTSIPCGHRRGEPCVRPVGVVAEPVSHVAIVGANLVFALLVFASPAGRGEHKVRPYDLPKYRQVPKYRLIQFLHETCPIT